jgi:hypothetical protein
MIPTQPLMTVLFGTLILLIFFSGAGAENTVKDTIPLLSDTVEVKRYAEQKVDQMLDKSVGQIDSLKSQLLDSMREVAYNTPHRVNRYRKYVDIEKRSNGSVYKWSWWYWIVKYPGGQKDTIWDKMVIERIH